tara:strand:- start:1934 stop:2506 length:573 start_codon:yes stop_codon:yes gene_type:complete
MAKMTQADRDAGLSQEDVDAGLRAGKSAGITDEDRARALKNAGESIVDRYRDYDKNPEAKAIPVDMGNSPKPRPAARPAPRQASAPLSREPMPNEIPSGYQPAEPRRSPPSRGRYDQNGPIGDLIDIIRNSARRGRGNPNPSIYRGEPEEILGAKRGGAVNKMKKKSSVSAASKRGDGIATKGKTKGRFV